MKKIITSAILAATAAAGVALTAMPAAADIVCNREGECWHVRGHAAYRREHGVIVHPDNWRWGRHDHYTWREHEGHGYWRKGVWIVIP
jgi:hypothetical protein